MNDYDDLDRELRYLNNVNNLDAKYMQLRFYELPDYDPDLAQDFTNCHYRLATASSTDDIEIPQAYVVPPTMLAAMVAGGMKRNTEKPTNRNTGTGKYRKTEITK